MADRVTPSRCGAVIKADAHGLGAKPVARLAQGGMQRTVDVTEIAADRLALGTLFDVIDQTQDINALAQQAGTNAYETSHQPRLALSAHSVNKP